MSKIAIKNAIEVMKTTKNKSAISMALFYKNHTKIDNWYLTLLLYDNRLIGKDPHDPNITNEEKLLWICELMRNPFVFFREFVKSGGNSVEFDRYNVNNIFLSANSINQYIVLARQRGKTFITICFLVWTILFRDSGRDIMLVGKEKKNTNDMLSRYKKIFDELPQWLKDLFPTKFDGNVAKDNTEQLDNALKKNKIIAVLSSYSPVIADAKPRGLTTCICIKDEHAFIPNIKAFELAAAPAVSTAKSNAIANGELAYEVVMTTPGNKNNPSGKYSYALMNSSIKFNEKFFDLSSTELDDLLKNNKSKFFRVTYTWRQLGLDEEWYEAQKRDLNWDDKAITAEIDIQWLGDDEMSVFSSRVLRDAIKSLIEPVYSLDITEEIGKNYIKNKLNNANMILEDIEQRIQLDVFKENIDEEPIIITLDTSSGVGRDYNAINCIDAFTGEQYATLLNNTLNIDDLTRVILFLLLYFENSIVVAELNHMGLPVIRKLKAIPQVRQRIFRQNRTNSEIEHFKKNTFKIKKSSNFIYGINTTSANRDVYFDVLRKTLREKPTIFKSKVLMEQIKGMIYTKNDRIDHQDDAHDDLLISFCLGLYVMEYHKRVIDHLISPLIISNKRNKLTEEDLIYEERSKRVHLLKTGKINSISESSKQYHGFKNDVYSKIMGKGKPFEIDRDLISGKKSFNEHKDNTEREMKRYLMVC